MRSATARRPPAVHPFLFDPRTLAAEAAMCQGEAFDDVHRPDVFFMSGLQLDRRGNVNLLGIPGGDGGWKVRGPGWGGAGVDEHQLRRLLHRDAAARAAHVRRAGVVDLGARRPHRARAGCASPAAVPGSCCPRSGVFEFDDAGDLRVRSLHEGVTAEQVAEATGFELGITGEPPATPAPTGEELTTLRDRVDVHGTLRD